MISNGLIDYLICGIVFTRGSDGATISEIRSDFYAATEQKCHRLNRSTNEIVDYLNSLPGLVMDKLPSGAFVWFFERFRQECVPSNAEKGDRESTSDDGIGTGPSEEEVLGEGVARTEDPSSEISKKTNQTIASVAPIATEELLCEPLHPGTHHNQGSFFGQSIPIIEISDENSNEHTSDAVPIPIQGLTINGDVNVDRLKAYSDSYGQLNGFGGMSYIGDDFMLSFITKEYHLEPETGAYPARCAHCVSGQTIGMALEEINNHPESFTAPAYLVNLGAMDILMGRDIYSIQTDYKLLIDRLRGMNKLPICTTVSPVGISQEESRIWSQLYQKLLLFNRFVEDLVSQLSLPFIDFWHPFSNAKGVPVMQYYQNRLTTVVADEQVIKFHMWNKLGRTALKSTLGSYLDN